MNMLFNVDITAAREDVAAPPHILIDILLLAYGSLTLADVLLTIAAIVEGVISRSHR